MNTKRFLAVTMAVTMVAGSSLTAFAANAEGATGTGTNTGHLDTDIFTIVYPTDTEIEGFFDFTIDPENILASADKFTDGTTAAGEDFANEDLVYFKQAADAEKTYASSSQAAQVGAKNYTDVDVTAVASIGDADEGKTIIPMVSSAEELEAATTPSLFLQLKVGDATAAISAESGATVVDTIDGQPDNFSPVYDGENDNYKLEEKEDTEWENNTAGVQLIGKVKGGTIDADVVAPTVTLTWEVTKHVDSYVSATSVAAGADRALTLSLPEGVTVSGVTIAKTAGGNVNASQGTHYTISGTTLTLKSVSAAWASVTVKYSDGHTDVITVTSN